MADIHTAGGLGSEIKFLVDEPTAARIRAWARERLDPDPHGSGPFGDAYRTTTLYLDTSGFDVFRRRGSYGRSKYRIRRYGGGDAMFVERKMRNVNRLAKRRTAISPECLGGLSIGNGAMTRGRAAERPVAWFERRVSARRLRPVCQVTYTRVARTSHGGAFRLTIDDALSAVPIESVAFHQETGTPILTGQAVVELKFPGRLPALFKQLVETFNLNPQRASKYRAAVDALMLAPAMAPETSGARREPSA